MRAAARDLQWLAGVDFNRFPTSIAGAAAFKQWVHVAVVCPEITLVANFSALPAPSSADPEAIAYRLALLIYADRVDGHVRRFARDQCAMPRGRTSLVLGDNRLVTRGQVHQLSLDEPALALHADLALREVAATSVLHHLRLGGAHGFHWAVAPRLIATGTIEHAGRTYGLAGAPAYRDRNWGSFRFGEVAWDWGYATAPVDGPPCTVIYARLFDAARTRVIEQQVLVWWDRGLLAAFRDHEVVFKCTGSLDEALVTVPPALALCRPGRAADVPSALTIVARSSRGGVEIRFARDAAARIIAPNEARLGTTAIYESFGHCEVIGRVDDQDIAFTGRGLFECVHG